MCTRTSLKAEIQPRGREKNLELLDKRFKKCNNWRGGIKRRWYKRKQFHFVPSRSNRRKINGFRIFSLFCAFFFFFYKNQTPVTQGEFWSVLVVGLSALSRPVVSASLHKQCTKRNGGFTVEGKVETRETIERGRTEVGEVWIFVEVLKVLKVDYHSVVGSGNYWVTIVAQSQFLLVRCLWTLILKAWRTLRVGASSSIDAGSAFQVLTYPCWNDRAIVAFDRTGTPRESRNE